MVDVALGLDRCEILDFEKLVKILVEGFHGDIELIEFTLVDGEGSEGFDYKRTVNHLQHLKFPRFVLLLLLHFFESYPFPSCFQPGVKNLAKCAAANQLLYNNVIKANIFVTMD